MPKILLVEDDNNLREIFQMRLQAEGYNTLVAADGEEGLVVAMKEKPDLVIADVMMPKLSGFEMVENLRSAPETKDAKVIMMTALGQAEDQARGEKLGVVKYLVKSQVTLEDFARVVKEVLGPGDPQAAAAPQTATTSNNTQESEGSMPEDTTPTNPSAMPGGDMPASEPSTPPMPSDPAMPSMPATGGQQTTADEKSTVDSQVNNFASTPAAAGGDMPASEPSTPPMPSDPMPPTSSEPPAAPTEPPASTDDKPANPPTDPMSNAL
ncbi:MAG TPA: response regulator [Candidatus Babeliales bacterium]|nr:response regulator [Candidatus Babeliales bacterium]